MTRRFAYVLVWLALTAEVRGFVFEHKWETPLTWLGTAIFSGLPWIHFPLWDVMVVITLGIEVAKGTGRKGRAEPLLKSMRITLASLMGCWIWGVLLQGGDAYQTMFQLHPFVIGIVVAYLLIATCRTLGHLKSLAMVVFFATLYRCFVLFTFYLVVASHLDYQLNTLTGHQDTPLFATGLLIVVGYAALRRSKKSAVFALASAIPICTAIQLNNRRLAWLVILVGMALIYTLLPKDAFKRRTNAALLTLSPILIAYIAIGWGHPTGLFKPIGSISTMFGSQQDLSSVMRDIENYNLTKTLRSNPLLGVGWGHQYLELVTAYDISGVFAQYRYLPHNSLLGLLAFSGALGFIGTCQLFPVATFLHMRAYRGARTPVARTAALVGLVTIVVCILEMWGDLGFNGLTTNVLMAVSLAVACRLPVLVGAWPGVPSPQSRQDE